MVSREKKIQLGGWMGQKYNNVKRKIQRIIDQEIIENTTMAKGKGKKKC